MHLAMLFAICALAVTVRAADLDLPNSCRQFVVVVAPEWNARHAVLQRWARPVASMPWKKVGSAVPVMIGEHGLGWGLGLHAIPDDGAPRKTEGDRRAPAGLFRLTGAFGTMPRAKLSGLKLPYRPLTPTLEAVDDPASRYYNQIVDRARIAQPDWRSSEHLAAIPAYQLGLIVAHNPLSQPGGGSCIFIHRWMNGSRGTAGCTALREADLVVLVRWLDPAQRPLLVQLPREVMRQSLPGF